MRNVSAICEGSCTAEIDPPSALLVVVSRSRCAVRRGETAMGRPMIFGGRTNAAEGVAGDCPAAESGKPIAKPFGNRVPRPT